MEAGLVAPADLRWPFVLANAMFYGCAVHADYRELLARPEVTAVVVATDESVRMRVDGKEPLGVPVRNLAARVRDLQGGDAATPVVISADKAVKYEAVVKVMDTLQRAGVQRVGLAVRTTGS